jgi:hypothetical protein
MPDRKPKGPESVCDGKDNDGNGIVDDVDMGRDGVCDCLLTATLGVPAWAGAGDVFATWLNARSSSQTVALGEMQLTREVLAPFKIIVAQDITRRRYSPAEVEALADWIREGGGLLTLSGYGLFENENVNALLAPSGIQYGFLPVLGAGVAPATLPITTWHAHPVSESVNRIGFNNGYEVTGAGTLIAEQDGIGVLRGAELGRGKVLVWGDEWITINSEWKDHPDYDTERLWLNILKWLSPAQECQVPVQLL